MRIALLGGSFDPFHLGHLTICQKIKASGLVDDVWLVPCGQHPFAKNMSNPRHRLALLRLQTEFPIYTGEIEKSQPSYSLQTLQTLSLQYPKASFSWIIGSDQVKTFEKWYGYEDLLQQFTVWVYPRFGSTQVSLLSGMKWLENVDPIYVSSTEIRSNISQNLSCKDLLLPEVINYIYEHKLYEK